MPDFSLGFMTNVKIKATLYESRGRSASDLARQNGGRNRGGAGEQHSGEARLSAGQIALAKADSERAFVLPPSKPQPRTARALYCPSNAIRGCVPLGRCGKRQNDFFNLTDAEQTLLRFGLGEVEARTQRELALAGASRS